MGNFFKNLSTNKNVILIVSIALAILICSLALKAILSQNITFEILDAKLDIRNDRIELAKQATKVQKITNTTSDYVTQIEINNDKIAKVQDDLTICRNELDKYLPNFDQFPREELIITEPIPREEIQKTNQDLTETQKALEASLDEILKTN